MRTPLHVRYLFAILSYFVCYKGFVCLVFETNGLPVGIDVPSMNISVEVSAPQPPTDSEELPGKNQTFWIDLPFSVLGLTDKHHRQMLS